MNCSNCGTSLSPGASMCPTCGTPVQVPYVIPGGSGSNPAVPTQYAPQQGSSQGYGGYEPTQRATPPPPGNQPDPYASQQGNGSSHYAPPPPVQSGQQGNGSGHYAPPPPVQPGPQGQQSNGSGYYAPPQSMHSGQQGNVQGMYAAPPLPPGQPQQAGRPRRGKGLLIALLIVVLVVVIGGGTGIFFFVNASKTATQHANATATANSARSAQQAQGTQTAHTTATAGAQATATAAVMNPYTQTGTLALSDPLTSNNQGQQWDENGNCAFKAGAYHVIAPDPNSSDYCIANASSYTDFALEVNITILSGDAGAIVFRVENTNPNQYYKFIVANDGSYALLTDNAGKINVLFQSSNTTAINAGLNQTNLIAIVAQGSKITAYSNHQMLDSITDSTFNHGQIGMDATVLGHATEVAFSNLRVWKL